jgi:ELWxxDGT repeat protein
MTMPAINLYACAAGLMIAAIDASAQLPTPTLVADINTGNGPVLGSDPGSFVRLTATQTLFVAFDPVHGRELWITDGTGPNTHLLYDFCPGACSGNPTPLNPANALALGVLYLSADDGARGSELWKVSNTGVVTFVRDINLGALGSNPGAQANAGVAMVFTGAVPTTGYLPATSADSGTELRKTAGTSATTLLVKDINSGTASSSPKGFGAGQTRVYFGATEPATGTELYITDGTGAGTVLRSDINGGGSSSPSQFVQLSGDTMFFTANDGATGPEPWITTATTTTLLKDILMGPSGSNPALALAFNSRIFFQASSATSFPSDNELWSTTGVPTTGTTRFKDICAGTCSGSPHGLVILNTAAGLRLLFAASLFGDPTEESLYVSDGTSGTTTTSIFSGGNISSLTVSGTLAYFIDSTNKRLYVTDGTMAGTKVIKDYGSAGFVSAGPLGAIGTNKVILAANDGFNGNEPYIAGPTSGTFSLLKNIAPDLGYSNPQSLINVGGVLYFSAFSDTTGRELWKVSDPNVGAELVADLAGGATGSNPSELTAFDGKLIFAALPTGSPTPKVLYISDGTPAGTHPLKDLGPGINLVYFSCLSVVGNRIYFIANGSDGKNIGAWISDGTDAGTVDINPGGITYGSCLPGVAGFAAAGSKVLFTASDAPRGSELWRTDGTAAGTAFVRDIVPGTAGSGPTKFVSIGNYACFSAKQDGANDEEPWCSDGTAQGTVPLGDLNSGSDSSQPLSFTRVGNSLVFSAFSPPTYNRRMWRSDGTLNSAIPLSSGYNPMYSLVGLQTQTFPGNGTRPDPPRAEFDGDLIYYSCEGTTSRLCIQDVRPGFEAILGGLFTIVTGTNSGGIDQLRVFPGGDALMSCWTATAGRELCRFNSGPGKADVPLTDIAPGAASSSPEQITLVADNIYFTADDGAHGRELWALSYKDTIDRVFHNNFD